MQSIRAKKSLGQNFLIDEEALTDIGRAVTLAEKHVIEVGPGYGALTEYILSHHPASLDMVELDPDMVEILDSRFMAEEKPPEMSENFHRMVKATPIALHHADVLHFTPPYDDYVVIANIPYYITSPILFHFLYDIDNPPAEMVIMMQEEVWEKILEGRAKKPHHSYLSLAMELACEDISIVRYVGRDSFDPPPRVDSIVLRFTVKTERNKEMEEKLLSLWRYAFTQPRKTLMSNLRGSPVDLDRAKAWILECGYDEKVRAEAVKMEDWILFITK
jgi:16S rRNA (adenine1518-N6/adenine1519-N6)-dimethyltransferase